MIILAHAQIQVDCSIGLAVVPLARFRSLTLCSDCLPDRLLGRKLGRMLGRLLDGLLDGLLASRARSSSRPTPANDLLRGGGRR